MARRGAWRRIAIGSVSVLVLLAAHVTWQVIDDVLAAPSLTISPQTTVATGPLKSDGSVDYVAALNARQRQRVTNDENAAIVLTAVLADVIEPADARRSVWRDWGVDPPADVPRLEGFGQFARRRAEQDLLPHDAFAGEPEETADFSKAMEGPWTAEQSPLLAEWLEANQRPLDVAREAVFQRHGWYVPQVGGSLLEQPFELLKIHETLARSWLVRANASVAGGDYDSAISDTIAAYRLSRLVAQGPAILDRLVAMAIDARAWQQCSILLQQPDRLSPGQWQRFGQQLKQLPPVPPLADVLDVGERWSALECLGSVMFAGDGDGRLFGDVPLHVRRGRVDGDAAARMINDWYDQYVLLLRAAAEPRDELADVADLAELDDRFEAMAYSGQRMVRVVRFAGPLLPAGARGRLRGELVGSMITYVTASPAMVSILSGHDRVRLARLDLVRVAVGLAEYRLRHGGYPAVLDELRPTFLAEIPPDRCTGGALSYSPGEGGYLLYSFGRNRRDDGGRFSPDDWDIDDLAIRVGRGEPSGEQ